MAKKRDSSAVHFGIRIRLTLQLLLLFAVGLTVINLSVFLQIQKDNETRIGEEMRDIQTNAEIYTRQLLMLNKQNNEAAGFRAIVPDLLLQLQQATSREIAAYTVDGYPLDESGFPSSESDDDLHHAMQGQAAYHMEYPSAEALRVYFSCPMVIDGRNVGILRFYSDYSGLLSQGKRTEGLVFWVTFTVFLLIFVLVQILANRIVRPVVLLAADSRAVSRRIGTEAGGSVSPKVERLARRKDEIGELAENYRQMLRTINEQFLHIQEDADHIRGLYEYDRNFFNNVTHELKTPLTTIGGYAELLQSDARYNEDFYQKAVGHIEAESRRLHEMVIRLLDMAALNQKLPFTKVDLRSLADSVCEAMALKAKRYGNSFVLSGEPGQYVRGREGRLRELLINLLDNAIKYGRENSPIAVVIDSSEQRVFLSVENAGDGIPEDQLDKLCIPFYRVDKQLSRERGSSGLGLSICQKIVQEHAGEMAIQSRMGESVTVTVALPCWQEGPPLPQGEEESR